MNKNKILVDEIIQKFDTDELSYFKLGSISGEVDNQGKDIIEHIATLAIPKSKVKNFFEQFKLAIEFKEDELELVNNKEKNIKRKETLGSPILINHTKLR